MTDLDPPLVVAGHSHAVALGVPPGNASRSAFLNEVGGAVAAIGGSWPRDDTYWAALVDAAAERIPVVCWDGNQHYGHFLFALDPPIDFTLSSAPGLIPDRSATWIPESMLRAFMAPSLEPLAALLDRLVAAGPLPVVVVGTPPPKGDESKIRAVLASEPYFVNTAQARGTELSAIALTPVSVLLKLWCLSQSMLRETATAAGAVFVPVPDRLRDDKGYLPTAYWSTDVTHANADFGQQMMIEVATVLRPMWQAQRSMVA